MQLVEVLSQVRANKLFKELEKNSYLAPSRRSIGIRKKWNI